MQTLLIWIASLRPTCVRTQTSFHWSPQYLLLYEMLSAGMLCYGTTWWSVHAQRLVWFGVYGKVGLVNCMVKCVNTKMGRTPTGSGCLRLVIMHNLKNEEERKGNLLQRSRKIAFSSMSEFSDWFCQPDQQLLDSQQQINAFHSKFAKSKNQHSAGLIKDLQRHSHTLTCELVKSSDQWNYWKWWNWEFNRLLVTQQWG